MAAAVNASGSPTKASTTKEEKKEKAKKKVVKDANGNELKRPLSAYMLYNNHRRPTLRGEHPGKWRPFLRETLASLIFGACRVVPSRPVEVDRR